MLENTERIQSLRENATVCYKQCSKLRKENWDGKAKPRELKLGDKVMMRKSGMNSKLSETWLGPYTILKVNSLLSYEIDTGSRKINSVHIQLLKEYIEREDRVLVKRITTVLKPDSENDTMEHEYAEVVVSGCVQVPNRYRDTQQWLSEYKDIMTKEPGLTKMAEFAIDTGDHSPIAQCPYNTHWH